MHTFLGLYNFFFNQSFKGNDLISQYLASSSWERGFQFIFHLLYLWEYPSQSAYAVILYSLIREIVGFFFFLISSSLKLNSVHSLRTSFRMKSMDILEWSFSSQLGYHVFSWWQWEGSCSDVSTSPPRTPSGFLCGVHGLEREEWVVTDWIIGCLKHSYSYFPPVCCWISIF